MAKVYPTDDKVILMLADSIRVEAANKLTIIGYLGESEINLLKPTVFPASLPLSIMFVLRDGEGTFNGDFRILDKNNTSLFFAPLSGPVVKPPGQQHGVIVNIAAFIVGAIGDYTFVLTLDQAQYRRVVRITSN